MQTLAKIDAWLEWLESLLRHALSKVGIQIQLPGTDERDRRTWRRFAFFIAAFVTLGLAIQSASILYHYEDSHMGYGEAILRTNRFTGTRAVRFKDKEQNAFVVYITLTSLGIVPGNGGINTKRDGKRWIPFEDYTKLVEQQREKRIRRQIEDIQSDAEQRRLQRDSERRLEEITREQRRRLEEMEIQRRLEDLEWELRRRG